MNKMPVGDKWRLTDNESDSMQHNNQFPVDFSYFDILDVKLLLKAYVWRNYVEKNRSLSTIVGDLLEFKYFYDFMNLNSIKSLKDITNNDISMYMSFLNTITTKRYNNALSARYKKTLLDAVKSIIHWGQVNMPYEVIESNIFTGNEFRNSNKVLKIDFIADDIVQKINIALRSETNPYLKYGIIILKNTGMRIGEMLMLKRTSLQPHAISGMTLSWYDYKSRKERIPLPVNNECIDAIRKLLSLTEPLVEKADNDKQDLLFLHAPKNSNTSKVHGVARNTFFAWMEKFSRAHGIVDANGKAVRLTTHMFRRTLSTDMLSKGVDLLTVRDAMGHSSAKVTKKYYADIKDKERAAIFLNIGVVGNINKIDSDFIPNSTELSWFKDNRTSKARMCDGYCTMPIQNGEICDRLLKKKRCYTCSRFITTPEYLDVHKNYLEELEYQVNNNIYGEHYAHHFIPIIEVLREIIRLLEGIKSGN